MKRVRFMGIGLLMCSLLLTSCGQDAPQRNADDPETEEEATNWEDIFPFENFPTEGQSQESAGNTGKVTPERIDNSIFRAKFEGTEVEGTGKAVDGVYRFNATKTDGESWHVKLECNYPTVAGRDYFVTYNFRSDVAGKVKFGDFQEFSIRKGDNSITGVMIASSGTSYLDLQLGMLSPFTIDFTSIEVKEYEDESKYENALPKPVNFERESVVYEKHDSGYAVIPVRREDTINVNFADAPDDPGVWKSRLYVRTGVIPELGSRYRVTADIMCHDDMPFEVLFNNGDEEKGYGALYEQSLKADEVKKIEAVVTGRGYGDELVMQLSLGKTPDGSKVIFGNVQVDKIIDNYTSMLPADFELDDSIWTGDYIEQMIPVAFKKLPLDLTYDGIDTIYEGHDDGYVVDLKESSSEATFKIKKAPDKADDRGVWKAKLYVATGVKLQPGQTYLVKYDLTPTGDQADYEVCFDGDSENAYGALYGRSLKAGQTDHVEQLITPESAGGPLTLRLQLGKTDSSKGNTYKLSNLSVESVKQKFTNVLPSDFSYETSAGKVKYVSVLPDDFAYTTGVNVTEQHDDVYTQSVSSTDDSATLDITEAPSSADDRGVWRSKLFINTGVTPEKGTKYAISFDVTGDKDQAEYEICFDGKDEKSYGALYGQKMTAGETKSIRHAFVAESDESPIIMRFQLGKTDDASGNKITVSNIKIAAITLGDTESILPDDFAYPTVSTTEPDEDGFVQVTMPSPNFSEAHDPGFEQLLDGSSLKISKVYRDPWNSKLFVNTNTTLEAGKKHRITFNIKSTKAIDQFEIDYNRDGTEKGFGALYERSIAAGETKQFVFETGTDIEEGNLVIQVMTGRSPVPNTITVSDVKIEKYVPEHTETIDVPEGYKDVSINISASQSCDDDYQQTLSGTALTIDAVSAEPGVGKSKLFIHTGKTLENGKKYKVTTNFSSEQAIDDFEICYNKDGAEKGYEADNSLSIGASDKTIVKEFTADGSGVLDLQFQLGKSPVGNTFKVNSVKLEEFVPAHSENQDVEGAYEDVEVSNLEAWEEHTPDLQIEQSVSGTSLTITQNHGVWESKLFADTGTKLEAGKEYKVTANVTSTEAFNFEVVYNNGSAEDAFGTDRGLSIGAGETKDITHEITTASDLSADNLVLQFMMGNSPANTFTVNSITLEVKEDDPVEIVNPKSFDYWGHEDYKVALSGDGSSASLITETAASPEVWKAKLFAKTGATLEAGKTYRISADVKADSETGYEICYNSGDKEKGFGAKYDLTTSEAGETVTYEVTPDHTDILTIQFSLGNSAAGNTVTVSNIKVEVFAEEEGENLMTDPLIAWAPVHEFMDAGYSGDLTNDDSSATLKLDTVASKQEDWKVKLFVETGAKLEKGKKYRISYKLKADKATTYNAFYNNGTEEKAVGDFYDLSTGNTMIRHTVKPSDDSELIIQLMLGNSPAKNNLTISDVKVEEVIEENPNRPINVWVHEDYKASLSNTKSSASLAIKKVPGSGREAWKIKLFAETGAKLKKGKTYRVSVDVKSQYAMEYEICYNNVEVEKELGAQYGLKATSSKKTVTYNITPEKDAELIIQFGLGNASKANTFTISNVKVEESSISSSRNVIPDFTYDSVGYISKAADGDYITSLDQKDSSAVFNIKKAPSDRHPWEAKVIVRTGVTPKSGKGYRVSVDIDSARSQNMFEVFYDGKDELAYGALYEQYLPAGKKTFSYIIYPGDSKGEISMQLRFGETNSTNGNVYKISNVKVEEVTFKHTRTPEIRNVSELDTQPGYTSTLERTPFKDTIRLIRTPEEGREAWKTKLFITTGATLQEGQKYRIRMLVKSIIPAPFEVCLNNKDVEKGLGGIFGLMSKPYGEYVEYSAYVKEDTKLVIQLSLGNCVAPNTIMVSDVKVEKAGKINLISDKIYVF